MVDQAALAAHLDIVLTDATIRGAVGKPVPRQGSRQLRPAGRPPYHHRDRPAERFRPELDGDPVRAGQVLTPNRPLLVRRDARDVPEPSLNTPDPNVVVCRRLDILPVEIVVRDYLTGTTGTSIWPMYRAGRRESTASAFPTACARTRSCPRRSSRRPRKASTGGTDRARYAGRDHRARAAAHPSSIGRTCLYAGLSSVRARPRDRRGTRPDPRRHEIRVRL